MTQMNPLVLKQQRHLLKSRIKKISLLNHSQSFRKSVKISVPRYEQLQRKNALHKHYFHIDKIELFGAP